MKRLWQMTEDEAAELRWDATLEETSDMLAAMAEEALREVLERRKARFEAAKARVMENHRDALDWLARH